MANNKLTNDNSSNGFHTKQNPNVKGALPDFQQSGPSYSQKAQQAAKAQTDFEKSRNACYTTNVQYTRKPGAIGKPMKRG